VSARRQRPRGVRGFADESPYIVGIAFVKV
jgi:hypothetical protein